MSHLNLMADHRKDISRAKLGLNMGVDLPVLPKRQFSKKIEAYIQFLNIFRFDRELFDHGIQDINTPMHCSAAGISFIAYHIICQIPEIAQTIYYIFRPPSIGGK